MLQVPHKTLLTVTGWLRWEGTCESHLLQSLLQQYHPEPVTRTSKQFLNISRNGDSTTSLGNLCQCCHPHAQASKRPSSRPEAPILLLQTRANRDLTRPLLTLCSICRDSASRRECSFSACSAGKRRQGAEQLHFSIGNLLHPHFHNLPVRNHSTNNPGQYGKGPVLAPWPRTLPCSGQANALHDHSPGFVCPFLVICPWPCDKKTQLDLAKQAMLK